MKKIISLILSVIMVTSVFCVPAFSADVNVSEITAEELGLLAAFGIYEEGTDLEKVITRAEAAEYLCRLMKVSATKINGYDSVYYDVTTETPYYGYIIGKNIDNLRYPC